MNNLIPYNLFEMAKHEYAPYISSFFDYMQEHHEDIRVEMLELNNKVKEFRIKKKFVDYKDENIEELFIYKLIDYDVIEIDGHVIKRNYLNYEERALVYLYQATFESLTNIGHSHDYIKLYLLFDNETITLGVQHYDLSDFIIEKYPFFLFLRKSNMEILKMIMKDKWKFIDGIKKILNDK
jgi:hypothetical protein